MQVLESNNREKFFTLSAISSGIREAVFEKFGERLFWIVAEISELNLRKGHCYLSLVEKLPDSAAPVCELKGILWANKYERVSQRFRQATGTDLSANTRILFQASVRYDVKWGLNLIVEDVAPEYTIGLLQKERDQTVARLKAEGIYEFNRNLKFPLVPQRLAVISAKDSRGYEDFLNKLVKNIYGYRYNVTLFPSLLQGERAATMMVDQLLEIFRSIENYDLVVIVRGGGGVVDLNCFNDYRLSRAVARYPIPVLTGIGHTTNISIVDEVAFADRITPTDAADFIIEKTRFFEERLHQVSQLLFESYIVSLEKEKDILSDNLELIGRLTKERFLKENFILSDFINQLRNNSGILLKDYSSRLVTTVNELQYRTSMLLNMRRQVIQKVYESKISRIPTELVIKQKQKIESLESSVRMLDPLNVLKRGYSITMKNGKVIRSGKTLNRGDLIKTILYEGNIESEVR